MNRMILPLLAALAALLSFGAGGAIAADLPKPGDPAFAVPAGKVEHTVVMSRVTGERAVASHERTEQWLSRDRVRTVVYQAGSSRILREIVSTPTETRVFDRAENEVRIIRNAKPSQMPQNTHAFEAAVQRAYVEQGITRVIGERDVAGRRALVVESVDGRWRADEPGSKTVAVVDAETFRLFERTTTGRGFQHATRFETVELLDAGQARAKMAMAKHPGAKVLRRTRR